MRTQAPATGQSLLKSIARGVLPDSLLRALRMRRNHIHFGSKDYRSIFNQIHRENHWKNAESASGGGSTVAFTESIRTELESWLTRERIASLADIPCGDFNWMRKVRLPDGCRYIGMDIVLELVERNRAR